MPGRKHKCLNCPKLVNSKAFRCRLCYSKIRKTRNGTFGEYRQSWTRVKKYGIDNEDFEVLYQAFRGKCGICEKSLLRITKGKSTKDRACIDHNHLTGNIRGILCHHCNTSLGMFLDSQELLEKAKDYLNGNRI
ncbi:Recombination endonuclease VII [uncultured archaeon]|nr:Recombination endonuclease VII [uncultured archaeon]